MSFTAKLETYTVQVEGRQVDNQKTNGTESTSSSIKAKRIKLRGKGKHSSFFMKTWNMLDLCLGLSSRNRKNCNLLTYLYSFSRNFAIYVFLEVLQKKLRQCYYYFRIYMFLQRLGCYLSCRLQIGIFKKDLSFCLLVLNCSMNF